MKVINANAIYLDPAEMHPYQFIELAGRTCYKSENKMTESSAKKFVSNLLKAGHLAMLEHAHIIIQTTADHGEAFRKKLDFNRDHQGYDVRMTPYLNITIGSTYGSFISGSLRTFIQLFRLDSSVNPLVHDDNIETVLHDAYPEIFDAPDDEGAGYCKIISRDKFIDTVKHVFKNSSELADEVIRKHIVHTIKFTCDRGVSHEFVRHRPASFAQESTRYCNYSNEKFGNEITVIRPCYWAADSKQMKLWKIACDFAESKYFDLLISGATPQEARSVLPNSLKTELIITATEDEWQHIINLRYYGTTGKPHPQMYEVMEIAYPKLVDNSNGRLK